MKCEICSGKVETTFLKKPLGTYMKDAKGKKHLICKNCQSTTNSKEELLKKL